MFGDDFRGVRELRSPIADPRNQVMFYSEVLRVGSVRRSPRASQSLKRVRIKLFVGQTICQ